MEDFACNLRVVKTKGHFFFLMVYMTPGDV